MNNTSDSEIIISPQWENILAASLIGVLSLITLTTYILIIVVIFCNRNAFAKHSYYALAVSLGFSDCITLALFLFYSVPCTLLQRRIFGDDFDIAMGVICNMAYFSALMCMCMTAINRYWAVCRYFNYNAIYRYRNVILLLCLIWLFGIIAGLFQAFPCCYLRYFYDAYTYGYDMDLWGNAYYIWFDRSVSASTIATIIICYSLVIAKKPSKISTTGRTGNELNNRQVSRVNLEKRLALQSGIVAFILIALDVCFTTIPEVTSSKWFMLLTSILNIVNCGCNPFIYLIFNSDIRRGFMALICRRVLHNKTSIEQANLARTVSHSISNADTDMKNSHFSTILLRRVSVV